MIVLIIILLIVGLLKIYVAMISKQPRIYELITTMIDDPNKIIAFIVVDGLLNILSGLALLSLL